MATGACAVVAGAGGSPQPFWDHPLVLKPLGPHSSCPPPPRRWAYAGQLPAISQKYRGFAAAEYRVETSVEFSHAETQRGDA